MRKLEAHEVEKRQKLVGPCHKLYTLFNEKKAHLTIDWRKEFDAGGIDRVRELFDKTLDIVQRQLEVIEEIIKLIQDQEKEVKEEAVQLDRHTRYGKVVENHFSFSDFVIEILHKEEPDVERLMKYFNALKDDISEQRHKLLWADKYGEGQKALVEKGVIDLAKKEFELLQDIRPFWHDWEVESLKIQGLIDRLKNKQKVSDEDMKSVREDIEKLLNIYHALYDDSGRAPQIGTELALNLYLNGTLELAKHYVSEGGSSIPIAVINIDITAYNNLDGSHTLGDSFINICYEELNRELARDFSMTEIGENGKPKKISGEGVVTILGRTRFKIVGVPKNELIKALSKIPDKIIARVHEDHASDYEGTEDWEDFNNLSANMLAGYDELMVGDDRDRFQMICIQRMWSTDKYIQKQAEQMDKWNALHGKNLDEKIDEDQTLEELREIEKLIAEKIHNSIKNAAAKAEYLEKRKYPAVRKACYHAFKEALDKRGIPFTQIHNPSFRPRVLKLEKKYLGPLTDLLVYSDTIERKWIGRNYIPEEEFEGRMIKKIAHQKGLDLFLTDKFFKQVKDVIDGKKDASELDKEKQNLIMMVLQKRHLEKSYDLRFTPALRENAYDEALPVISILEGPQVFTFVELDGFNAFNKMYKPDKQDTFYHAVLKMMYVFFDKTLRQKYPDLRLRMTKQGDEIWMSYPRYHRGGEVSERDHMDFLEKIRLSLLLRDQPLTISNPGTVDWIPLLPQDYDETMKHLENANANNRNLLVAENRLFQSSIPIEDSGSTQSSFLMETRRKFIDMMFPKGITGGRRKHFKQDEKMFDSWIVIDDTREITGSGIFGPDKLKYPYLLFHETVKKSVKTFMQGKEKLQSARLKTGRIIRLGTTMGYSGFNQHVVVESPAACQKLRKNLNNEVEVIRKTVGRGVTRAIGEDKLVQEILEEAA